MSLLSPKSPNLTNSSDMKTVRQLLVGMVATLVEAPSGISLAKIDIPFSGLRSRCNT